MLSFREKIFTKDIIMVMVMIMVMILTVQGKWGHCPPTCNIINEGSSSQPESGPATVTSMENNANNPMADVKTINNLIIQ